MLNHTSKVPLYLQLAELLEKAINDDVYKEDEKLPSESVLCKSYGVSRITVRQAISLLEQKKMVLTVHGKGSFVKLPMINQRLVKVVTFAKILQEKGLTGYTRIYSFGTIESDPRAEILLGPGRHGPIRCIKLIGFAQGFPMVFYDSLLHPDIAEEIYEQAKAMEREEQAFSTYDLLQNAGISIGEISQSIGAINAGQRLSAILEVPDDMAMIRLESTITDKGRRRVEHKIGIYRGDRYSFELKREM